MPANPVEVSLELKPRSRFDVIEVTERIASEWGDMLDAYKKSLYCSFHTTAGYFEQSLCARLHHSRQRVDPFIRAFQKLFPAEAEYHHDQLQLRTELSDDQRKSEPKNADSHLIFISSGLKNCVTYVNQPGLPVYFIDLDGVNGTESRNRQTKIIAFNHEETVHRVRLPIPVSKHPIDSVNLKDPRNGFIDQLNDLLTQHDVEKGRIDIALARNERHAGLTVNEYETLLMRYDLAEVLRNPIKYMAMQGKHMLLDPKAIPFKTINYAKYDFVHFFNELMDAFRVSESVVEKILSKFIAVPAARFLRMKRNISLLVSEKNGDGRGQIIQGTYQSPILVQWSGVNNRTRYVDVTITRFR